MTSNIQCIECNRFFPVKVSSETVEVMQDPKNTLKFTNVSEQDEELILSQCCEFCWDFSLEKQMEDAA